jgi:hypothetical protein
MEKGIFCFTTKHKVFADYKFPEGSIVIDPFRIFKNKDNIIYHGVGCNY